MLPLLLTAWLLVLLVAPSGATVYYLNPASGNDANTPAAAQNATTPWKTLTKAKGSGGTCTNFCLKPGDTLNILANPPGQPYTASQYKQAGDDGLWYNIHAVGTAGAPITIQANPGDTVVFDGGQNQVGWQQFLTTAPLNFYIVIQGLTFQNYYGNALTVGGHQDYPGATGNYFAVVNCSFRNLSQLSSAAITWARGDHILIKGNTIFNSGDPSMPGGNGSPVQQHGLYGIEPGHDVVLDGNIIEKISGFGIHLFGHDHPALPFQQTIVRRNTIVNAHYASLIFAGGTFSKTYAYNNTFYSEQVPFSAIDGSTAQALWYGGYGLDSTNMTFINNIGQGYVFACVSAGHCGAATAVDNSQFHGSLTMNYNMWQRLDGSNNLYAWPDLQSLTTFRNNLGYEQQSQQANPLFTNPASRDFTLQATPVPSPAIDAGRHLTTVTSATGGGMAVTVADAGFFHDGFGFPGLGDSVKIGSNASTPLCGVNYSTNTLTLCTSLTWTNGDFVDLPYNGSAPDMGAVESAGGGGTSTPGLQLDLRFDEGSGATPQDSSGAGRHGTFTNAPLWQAGRQGRWSLNFPTGNDYVTSAPLPPLTTYTWALWLKSPTAPNTSSYQQPLFNGPSNSNFGFSWSHATAGADQAALHIDGNGALIRARIGAPLAADTWYWIAATYDGANLRQYLNCHLESTTPVSSIASATGGVLVGGSGFVGSADHVQVWSAALTASELCTEYQRQAGLRRHHQAGLR